MSDHLKTVDPQFRVHGVPATVTVPDGAPVATRVIDWGRSEAFPGAGGDMPVTELRREMSIRRDHVPLVPTGTEIDVTGVGVFHVDAIVPSNGDLDVVRVVVT